MLLEKYKYFIIAIIIGVGLMVIQLPSSNEKEVLVIEKETINIKEELEEVLSQINGAGRVSVMVTAYGSEEYEYLQDENISTNTNSYESDVKTVLASKQGGGEDPIIIRENYPLYKGALIVCDGGADPLVKLEITTAVSSLLGISSNNISITKMKE